MNNTPFEDAIREGRTEVAEYLQLKMQEREMK
jgi:hypothetical protein